MSAVFTVFRQMLKFACRTTSTLYPLSRAGKRGRLQSSWPSLHGLLRSCLCLDNGCEAKISSFAVRDVGLWNMVCCRDGLQYPRIVLYLINNNNNVWTHGLNIVCSNCRSVLIRMMLLCVTVFYTDIIICDYSQLQTALLELCYENAHAAGRSTYKVARWTIPCQ